MLRLTSFNSADLYDQDELEALDKIFDKYKYALAYIGVDFSTEQVQEALLNCTYGFEDALRAVIAYWYYLTANSQPFYPNACLIEALLKRWSGRYWKDEYLENPNFKNPCQRFWEEAAQAWGYDLRNQLIVDVNSDSVGNEFIQLHNEKKISLSAAKRWGWERLKEYALQQLQPTPI